MSWFTPKSNAALLKLANKCNGFADPEVHSDNQRQRDRDLYKSVRKEQTRFSGCDHFDRNDVSNARNSRNVGNSCNAKNASATSNTCCK